MAGPTVSSPFLKRLVAGAVLVNLLAVALAVLSLEDTYRHYRERAGTLSRNLAGILSQELDSTLNLTDFTLTTIAADIQRYHLQPSLAEEVVSGFAARLPDVDSIGLAEANGQATLWSGPAAKGRTNLADRDYFQWLRDHPEAGLVVTGAVQGKLTGRWQIVLARRMEASDHTFVGIVFAVLVVDRFVEVFSRVDVGPHGVVVLRHRDGSLVARAPRSKAVEQLNNKLPASADLEAMLATAPVSGTYSASVGYPPTPKTNSYHQVGGHPLVVIVGLADEDTLAEWRSELVKHGVAVALVMAVTVMLFRAIYRSWQHTETARTEAEVARCRLEAVLQNTPIGLTIISTDRLIESVNLGVSEAFGLIGEELIGRSAAILYGDHQQWQDLGQQAYPLILAGGTFVDEMLVKRRDGSRFWCRLRGRLVDSSDPALGVVWVVEDISAAKKAERRIAELSKLNSTVISASTIGVFVYRADGSCLLVNEAAAKMIGGDVETLKRQNFRSLASWQEAGMLAAADAALATGTSRHLTHQCTSSFGHAFWIDADFTAFDIDGEPHLLMTARDITAQRQAEEALRASEEKLRSLYELSPLGIALTDMQGRYIEFNEAFRRITGYPAEDLKALDYWALTPRSYEADEARQLEALEKTGRYGPYEKEYRRREGSLIPLRLNGVLVTGPDGQSYIWSIVEDISESKLAEQILTYREELYRGLVESQSDFVVRLDRDGRFVFVNAVVAEAFGRTPSEMVGMHWRDIVAPQDHELTAAAIGACVAAPPFRATVDSRLALPGGPCWVAWEGCGIRGMDGSITEVQAVGRDITEWVGQRERLNRLVRDLDASNQELEQFAYVASHDLREPLRMISSYLGLIQRNYADRFDDDAREFFAFARDGAVRMDRMVLDLLEFSRVGRINEPFAQVKLAEVVAEALDNLALTIKETGAVVSVAPDLPIVMGWNNELVRLVQNLVANALKYRHPDRPPVLSIGWSQDDREWILTVTDNGIGIAAEFFQRIFAIFQRLHTREAYDGTGIGLALCRKIVEHHGGRIWVDSTPDVGSTFSFTLAKKGEAS